jgi:hypothetical protein
MNGLPPSLHSDNIDLEAEKMAKRTVILTTPYPTIEEILQITGVSRERVARLTEMLDSPPVRTPSSHKAASKRSVAKPGSGSGKRKVESKSTGRR